MRIVGEAAWRSCRQLQVVHLPDTVVSLLHGAFSRCRATRVVIAPGCQHFGAKVFEECCSLTQIGVTQCPGNILAPQAQLRPRVFQGCTALQRLDLVRKGAVLHILTEVCLTAASEAGIVALYLPSDFNRIGTAACVSCQQLQTVDLSQARVSELLGSTFAHCSQLQQLSLPKIYESLSKKPFSNAPRCKKSASHHPFFFPRARTPCGHGAQVIIEGRESQLDGGENNKDHNNNPKTTNKGPQAESPPSCSLSSVLGETGETRKSV